MYINNDELIIHFSSKYVPSLDGKKYRISLSDCSYDNYKSGKNYRFKIGFEGNDLYSIIFNYTKKDEDLIEKIQDLIGSEDDGPMMDSMDKTNDHHYGDLVIMTLDRLKKLKVGEKYYIVWGQSWDNDFIGKHGIAVLDYKGVRESDGKGNDDKNFYLKGDKYITGDIISINKKYDAKYVSCSRHNNYFNTGTGNDPVHLITKWQTNFHPPAKLPKANLFKE